MPKVPVKRAWAHERRVHARERSVHTEWWIRGESPKPGELVTPTLESDFYVPSIALTDRGYPGGTADQTERPRTQPRATPIQPILPLYRDD